MNEKKPANPWVKSLLIWVGILFGLVLFVQMIGGGSRASTGNPIAYSEFVRQVDQGNVRSVTMSTTPSGNSMISGRLTDGGAFSTTAPGDAQVSARIVVTERETELMIADSDDRSEDRRDRAERHRQDRPARR